MNWKNIMLIVRKDWKGTIKKKEISLPMLLLPLMFSVLLPILMLIGILFDPEDYISAFAYVPVELLGIPPNYNVYLKGAAMMIKMMILPFFLFIPAIIPTIIASDSFAGEKERKTMESIALLPITKTELILGKVLTAFIPSILLNFSFFVVMGIEINLMFLPHLEGNILVFGDLTFLLSVLALAPAFAFVNVLITTIISSRVKDLKSAQSIAGAVVVPLLILIFVQMFNPAFLSPVSVLIFSGILLGINIILIDIANKLLDSERLVLTL